MSLKNYKKLVLLLLIFSFFTSRAQDSIDVSKVISSKSPNILLQYSTQFSVQKSKRMGVDVITYQYIGDDMSILDIPVKSIVFLVFEEDVNNIEYLKIELLPSRKNEETLLKHFQKNMGDYILGDSSVHDSKEYVFELQKGTFAFQYFPVETGIENLEMGYISKRALNIENEIRKKHHTRAQEALPSDSVKKQ